MTLGPSWDTLERPVLSLLLLGGLVLSAADANACKCLSPAQQRLFPAAGATGVPRDAHVWVLSYSPFERTKPGPAAGPNARHLVGQPVAAEAGCELTVNGVALESSRFRHGGYRMEMIEHVPIAPFPARAKVRVDCRAGHLATNLDYTFETGTDLLGPGGPPALGELSVNVSSQRTSRSDCDEPGMAVAIAFPSGPRQPFYAIWRSTAGAPVDHAASPATIVTLERGRIELGGFTQCDPGRPFDFGYPGARLRLGIRPVDQAGRMGPASEVSFEVPIWRGYQPGELASVSTAELAQLEARARVARSALDRNVKLQSSARLLATIVAWLATVLGPIGLALGLVQAIRARSPRSGPRSSRLPIALLSTGMVLTIIAGGAHWAKRAIERKSGIGTAWREQELGEERGILDAALAAVQNERTLRPPGTSP